MNHIHEVPVGAMDPRRFASVLSEGDYENLVALIGRSVSALQGRVIWNVNSTARGGGVAELLHTLLGYSRGAGVDARWCVISGTPEFFDITKRIHNNLHGEAGDGGGLTRSEQSIYEGTLALNADELAARINGDDIVILHDPQTAGLVDAARSTGAKVIWRCHVGLDRPNKYARTAWRFLRRYVLGADAYVFSRAAFVWSGLAADRIALIQPSIDAFSPKNARLSTEQILAILAKSRIVPRRPIGNATFTRSDGSPGRVDRRAEMLETAPLSAGDRVVLQVSRWDRLKDPLGVLRGFVEHVAPQAGDAHLVLAGPEAASVTDDPEGKAEYEAVRRAWYDLDDEVRARVHLCSLPMADPEENAAIVNALQRHASVVVQKSLAEGFGLTVAEAMWKERPVVASRIGGIQDQIIDGESGVLLDDPHDLRAFGAAITGLLADPERAGEMGLAAHGRIRDHFLGPYHLGHYFDLIDRLVAGRVSADAA